MQLRWLLRRELAWVRRNAVPLLFVLVLLPGASTYAALGFQHVLPRDAPVAVVPQDEAVTDDDLAIAAGAATTFAEPVRYDSRARAFDALERERVYAVVAVPARLADEDREPATVHLYTDGRMVPYREPSRAVASVLEVGLSRVLPVPVEVERHQRGPALTLSEYLIPAVLMMLTMVLAFGYLPYALVREARALDRVRVRASLLAAVGGKLGTFALSVLVLLAVVAAASAALGYRVAPLAVGALVVYPLAFVHLGAVAASVTVLSRFATWGRLVNLALLLFSFAFTGLIYPVGFFSALRRELVRLVPAHYAVVAARGHVLGGRGPAEYPEAYGILLAATLASLAALWGSTRYFERRAR